MFDYESLALNVSSDFGARNQQQQVTKKASIDDNVLRRLSGESQDTFDCSASSGYGSSCNGTPLASPALLSSNFLTQNLQKMLNDCDVGDESMGMAQDHGDLLSFLSEMSLSDHQMDENMGKLPTTNTSTLFSQVLSQQQESINNCSPSSLQHRDSCATPLSPAVEDGFSVDEIAQFAQLLTSPKKAPPVHYQCHICFNTGHYISDCPMRFNNAYAELTPYQGRKKCYGEFTCGVCKRRWTSQNSVANEAQNCIKCSLPVFPHKQLPVDKAVSLGLVKAQRTVPTKLAPIGSGRISVRH
ncbi:Zinc finger CCHC domain-containing protein 24 [Aphelenchoides bicaudatus]|nr:Zinc finger CCHC domain-containing protein 24 [Aphelenchoides bicaudatus]